MSDALATGLAVERLTRFAAHPAFTLGLDDGLS